ncbi:hypothetical protein FNW02_17995 [Komarekiella sp. 'clone 1']|uniref:Uncharacterized protein n=1 Tax=Komarekiella delphini-convector SJRDD-AB1 TaxID=2593771 RepID=A0AA40SZ50_9NOST|nr:hypothetical protein [Komarekiella delphini-convector]MBD6617668.1 hypothetical protein [Komarekiella delphini-convector SJRDD-AB1]
MVEFLGIIFLLTGLWMIIFSAHMRTLTCNRVDSNQYICEILESGLLWSKVIPLGKLISAEVETKTTGYYSPSNVFNTFYGVILFASRRNFPFTLNHTISSKKQEAIVFEINSFVSNPAQKCLTVREDRRFSYCFSGLLAIAAAFLFFIL